MVSTHDQLLGGSHGQSFLGCRFPADPAYRHLIFAEALKIGARLGREGVVGRFGVDFVVTRSPSGEWRPHAIEINLRNGGTTHPFLTLQALTDGSYDSRTHEFLSASGQAKYYIATDHLEAPEYARITPDDLLDIVPRRGLIWQSYPRPALPSTCSVRSPSRAEWGQLLIPEATAFSGCSTPSCFSCFSMGELARPQPYRTANAVSTNRTRTAMFPPRVATLHTWYTSCPAALGRHLT